MRGKAHSTDIDENDDECPDLREAILKFQNSYTKFAKRNQGYFLIDHEFDEVLKSAEKEMDLTRAADIFGTKIHSVFQTLARKNRLMEGSWTSRLGTFMRKVYPIARIAVGVAGDVGDVSSLSKCADMARLWHWLP